MRLVQVILFLVFLGAMLVFAMQNMQVVPVRFLKADVGCPVAFLAVSAYVLGMLSGWTVWAFVRRSVHVVADRRRGRA